MKPILQFVAAALLSVTAAAAEPAISAKDLAAKLSAMQQDGSSYARMKLGGLQVQVKQRRAANSTELVYQVLWPKDRAGETVLLKQSGNQVSGTVFTPPDKVRALTSAQMKESLLGCALSYADVLENFFAWGDQKYVGSEVVDRVPCEILESRSTKGQRFGAATVRSWIDMRRMVPMRVEKYLASGAPFRRIETNQVVSDDTNRNIPAHLTIYDLEKGSTTVLDGSKLKHGVKFADAEFTPQGLSEISKPPSGG